MSSYTERIPGCNCPKCGSEDFNHTVTTSNIARFEIYASEWYCNRCEYYARLLMVDGKPVINELE